MMRLNNKDSGEEARSVIPRDRGVFHEVVEDAVTSQLEVENLGLRRLVIELIQKNQRLREELRLARGECEEASAA